MEYGQGLVGLLEVSAGVNPAAAAILGLDRPPLSHGRLLDEIRRASAALRTAGVGRADRVAIVLPNGPEMAVCGLAVSAAAISAPLNPAYSAAEYEFYLSDLRPKLLLTRTGTSPAVETVAHAMGIPVIGLHSEPDWPAGVFHLDGPPQDAADALENFPAPGDTALVLHTSGSTARPKMVPLTHANLCASAASIAASLGLTEHDRCLNIMPLFHIHGLVGAVLSSLRAGGSVVCAPGPDARAFFSWLARFQTTWYTAVPAMHQAILARAAQQPEAAEKLALRFIRSCSSALAPALMARMEAAFGVPVVEAYGMTEASHQMAVNPLPPAARKPGSVGRATGCRIAVLDSADRELAPEEIGEVAIRGAGITRGYENNPEANAGSFTGGWFRTGDQGRIDAQGYLFLTGRIKEIINRGGEKIAPREIDEVLLDHPAVKEAMAFSMPDDRLGEEVAAAVVLREPGATTDAALRAFVAARLADFKVPRRIVFLDELPKGPTGKPQRIGLAARLAITSDAPPPEPATASQPLTATQQLLAELWCELLGGAAPGRAGNFFELGGDSLLGAQLSIRVRGAFGVELPAFELFGNPTLGGLAAWISAAPQADPTAAAPIPRAKEPAAAPLSFAQQRLWFLSQFEEESTAYVMPVAVRLRGPLDREALARSLAAVVERHHVPRTRFMPSDGLPFQVVDPAGMVPLEFTDQSPGDAMDTEARIHRLARDLAHRPFDLARDFPLRATLAHLGGNDHHALVLAFHHIASDGLSKSIFFRELAAFYNGFIAGAPPALDPLPIQYADYARWRTRQMDGPASEKLIAYWKARLAGAPQVLDLPLDRPRPVRQTFHGARVYRVLPESLAEELRRLSRTHSATLFMTLLAGFQAVLSRYSGQTDICVGTPIGQRPHRDTETLIGPFINTVVMRTGCAGDPGFGALVARTRETALGAYQHQALPFEKLVEALGPERNLRHSPLFQAMFQLRNFPALKMPFTGVEAAALDLDTGTAQFDLTLELTETPGGLAAMLNYNSDLWDRSTAERFLGHYRTLLEAGAASPDMPLSRLPLMDAEERNRVLVEWNRTAAPYPPRTACALFEEQAARTPDAIAAEDAFSRWTYAELERRATGIAAALLAAGARTGEPVAIAVGRSTSLIAALLGVWKAGCCYLPLDPQHPSPRLHYVLDDSGARLLLASRRFAGVFPEWAGTVVYIEDCPPTPPMAAPAEPDGVAYILYTSGSTGQPKGVPVRHRSLTNLLWHMRAELALTPADVVLAITTATFDIAAVELVLPLIAGARIHVAGEATVRDPHALTAVMDSAGITLAQATPATWRMLVESGWPGRPGLRLLTGGEALTEPLARQLLARGTVWNGYGPTETTIYSTVAKLDGATGPVPIGRPIANTRVYVLDANGQPLPAGVPGELHIGGDGVSEGYWKLPALTSERFVPDPFSTEPGARLYRTGDLVRWLAGGSLTFLRRLDGQVKIRGHRVELGEIEAALAEHPDVRAAAARLDGTGAEARVVAIYTAATGVAPDPRELRDFLKARLPGYMMPAQMARVDAMPLTPSGKIDRNALALPAPAATAPPAAAPPEADLTETALRHIWEDVLDRRPIAPGDDFFDLGGHSLLGARLLARVERIFGIRLPAASLFEAPTVGRMAALLRGGQPAWGPSRVFALRSAGTRTPLYFLHPPPLFNPLFTLLPADQPAFAVSTFDSKSLRLPLCLDHIAARQAAAIRQFQPEGPVILAGWCADGTLAYEVARQLTAAGGSVPLIVMIDTFHPRSGVTGGPTFLARNLRRARNLMRVPRAEARARIAWWTRRLRSRAQYRYRLAVEDGGTFGGDPPEALQLAIAAYDPPPYSGRVLLVRAERPQGEVGVDASRGWRETVSNLVVRDVPGSHAELFTAPYVEELAKVLREETERLPWKDARAAGSAG